MKRLIRIFIILIISILSSYFTLTIKDFCIWCNNMQFSFVNTDEEQLKNLDAQKIQYLGESIEGVSKSIEENLKGTEYEKYNSLGITVWKIFQLQMNNIVKGNITKAVFMGSIITFAYIIITNSKMSVALKFAIGYVGIMIIYPPIYMYSYTGRLWNIITMYVYNVPKSFYIIYTVIFVVMYIINYKIGSKLTNELNKLNKN